MNTDRTVQQWLALDDLPTELARVLTPGPWEHRNGGHGGEIRCNKCFAKCDEQDNKCEYHFKPCLVPDPITIDWNTAMEWFRKYRPDYAIFRDIYMAMHKSAEPWHIYLHTVWKWIANMCEVKEARIRLIAAAMAAERKEE